MNDEACSLDGVKLFSTLTVEDRRRIEALSSERTFEAGEVVYGEGTPGDSMFAVLEGAVELQAKMGDRDSHPLLTLREGSVFGLVEIIDPQGRAVTAKALAPTKALEITRTALEEHLKEHADSGLRILLALAVGCARQLRIAVDLVRENLAWTLDVSGAGALNLPQLISGSAEIDLVLPGGTHLEGTLLKVEASEAGHQLFIRDRTGRIHLVPYHSVVSLSFPSGEVDKATDLTRDF